MPYEGRSPHAEISEDRAVALWRFALERSGSSDRPDSSRSLAFARARILWRACVHHRARPIHPTRGSHRLSLSAGYEKQVTCEMPGQYAVRGGIIDIFSPEAPQPVRVELLGDTIESIRAFDPNTQRSTNPVERATLMPLTEFPRRRKFSNDCESPPRPAATTTRRLRLSFPVGSSKKSCAKSANRRSSICGPDPLVIDSTSRRLSQTASKKYREAAPRSRSMSRTIRWPSRPAPICGATKNGSTGYNGCPGWRSSILPLLTRAIRRINTCFARSPLTRHHARRGRVCGGSPRTHRCGRTSACLWVASTGETGAPRAYLPRV